MKISTFSLLLLTLFSSLPGWSAEPETFLEYCTSRELSAAQIKTLQALFSHLKMETKPPFPQEDCEVLEKSLSKNTSLAFSGIRDVMTKYGLVKDLWSDGITDLSFVRYFPNITALDLARNQGVDITPLKEMPNLSRLSLALNREPDLETLGQLENLTALDLNFAHIHNLMALRNLKHLTQLVISGTDATRLGDLGDVLANLTWLEAASSPIEDWEVLLRCHQLNYFKANGSPFSDISVLRNSRSSLQELSITATGARSLEPLADFKELKSLDISDTRVSDLRPLAYLRKLEVLSAERLRLSDLAPLENLSQLRKVYLHSNKVRDLSPLKGLKDLEVLDVQNTLVTESDLKVLADLVQPHKNGSGKTIALRIKWGERSLFDPEVAPE